MFTTELPDGVYTRDDIHSAEAKAAELCGFMPKCDLSFEVVVVEGGQVVHYGKSLVDKVSAGSTGTDEQPVAAKPRGWPKGKPRKPVVVEAAESVADTEATAGTEATAEPEPETDAGTAAEPETDTQTNE